MIQTLSLASTATPIVAPMTQWFGSGFGHIGSTSKRGACTPAASTFALSRSTYDATVSTPRTTREIAPAEYFRFMVLPRQPRVGYHTRFGRKEQALALLSF